MLTEEEIVERVKNRFRFVTKVGKGPAPHKVSIERYGHHASYVRDGYRVWGFVDEKGRDQFAIDYNLHQVK